MTAAPSRADTRAASTNEFRRVIHNVLNYDATSRPWRSLSSVDINVMNFIDFTAMTKEEIYELEAPAQPANGGTPAVPAQPLSTNEKKTLLKLLHYFQFFSMLSTSRHVDWTLLDKDAWDAFVMDDYPTIARVGVEAAVREMRASAAGATTSASLSFAPKVELSVYPKFSGEVEGWIRFKRTTTAIAQTHKLSAVFDDPNVDIRSTFAAGSVQLADFDEKSHFVYSIFTHSFTED